MNPSTSPTPPHIALLATKAAETITQEMNAAVARMHPIPNKARYAAIIERAMLEVAGESEKLIADLVSGERVILPKTKQHAESMYRVAFHFLSDSHQFPVPAMTPASLPAAPDAGKGN